MSFVGGDLLVHHEPRGFKFLGERVQGALDRRVGQPHRVAIVDARSDGGQALRDDMRRPPIRHKSR